MALHSVICKPDVEKSTGKTHVNQRKNSAFMKSTEKIVFFAFGILMVNDLGSNFVKRFV